MEHKSIFHNGKVQPQRTKQQEYILRDSDKVDLTRIRRFCGLIAAPLIHGVAQPDRRLFALLGCSFPSVNRAATPLAYR